LLDEYQRVCDGQLGLVSLSGVSGMGKTRLIEELELPIVAKRGYFTFGKFDQFATQLPYSAFLSAFSRLIRQILTEDAERIAYWRIRMLDVLGTSGQLVTNMMPELEAIIGKQPDLQSLPAVDEFNRFIDLFSRFMRCLASEEHPLVLFLDDIQWCDHGTLELLQVIYRRPENHPYLLIIGAYRDNEVDENHPVVQMETAIEQFSQSLLKIHLEPLDKTAANQMVADMLSTRPSGTQKLTATIYAVTGGNPLYIAESLRWLHESERLQLSDDGSWSSVDGAIEGVELPENAKDLFVAKQKNFPEDVRDLLATGALLGAQFEAIDLADIHEISLPKLYETLSGVFTQRILQIEMGRLYFFHDQIQAAAANFLDGEQQKLRHRLIARTFINRLGSSRPEVLLSKPQSQLFSIVEHLAAGSVEHSTDEERFEEARLNYYAGLAALTTLALDACNHYLIKSLELCPDNTWDSDYEFMLSLHKKLAHAALITGDQKRANEIVATSIEQVRSDLDKAEFLYEQSVAFAALGDLNQAIEIAARALAMLDYALPLTDTEIQQEITESQARLYSEGRDIWQELLSMPPVEGRLNTLIQKLYGELLGYFYFNGQIERCQVMSLRAINFSIKNGVDDFTCYALGCMAFIHCLNDNYPFADKYESAALELVKKYPNTFGAVKAKGAIVWATMYLRRSTSDLRTYSHDASIEGIGCGELRYGSLVNCVEHWYGFIQGDDIPLLDSELEQVSDFARQRNIAMSQTLSEAIRLSVRPLLERGMFYGDNPDIAQTIQKWAEEEQTVAVGCYFVLSSITAYYNHRYLEAEALLIQAEPFLPALSTSVLEKLWFVFRYLVGLKNGFKGEVESYLDRLLEWSSHGPMLKPYMGLIEAEIVAKGGNFKETRNGYLDAIDSAHQQGYLLLEAFLNERLYRHLQASNHHSSELYRDQANQLYQSCGVLNRVTAPGVVVLPSATDRSDALVKPSLPTQPGQNIDDELDVRFLFDVVKTISSELDLDKLMGTILTSVMARLGAKTGYLLIAEDNLLEPRFKAIKTDTIAVISYEEATFDTDKLCSAIVNYAFNSKEKVIIENAMEVGEFVAD
ncbi:MAG: AAA family ATPase, partial [Proteobacteria bacterium]|nr:AAA family ATPase [Pseudomonadota bacterium]